MRSPVRYELQLPARLHQTASETAKRLGYGNLGAWLRVLLVKALESEGEGDAEGHATAW